MKVLRDYLISQAEAAHLLEPQEAVRFYQGAMANQQPIEGLTEMRRSMPSPFESEILDRLHSGQWRIFDEREASVFHWGMYEGRAKEQQQSSQPKLPVKPRKVEKSVGPPVCVVSSYRRFPLKSRECSHGSKGRPATAITDASGIVDCPHTTHDDQMLVRVGN